jgi:hypothetical protein
MKANLTRSLLGPCHQLNFVPSLALTLGIILLGGLQALAQNSTIFGPNVYVFTPTMTESQIETALTSIANDPSNFSTTYISNPTQSQFSTTRTAILFMPGNYPLVMAPVGYYESIAGLGTTPGAVSITGYLSPQFGAWTSQTTGNGPQTSLGTYFWRSMENLTITPTQNTAQSGAANTLLWGVSQAAPLRRMQVNGSVLLSDSYCGSSSGGFAADVVVTGTLEGCSQQQWYTRNSALGSWTGDVWNMVFSGVQGAPTPNYPTLKYTVLPTTPVSREKPYLYVDGSQNYNVFVPTVETNSSNASWVNNQTTPGYSLPIADFLIATPTTTLAAINSALAYGQNLILTPGIYKYNGSINITNPNTIVLGLGYATLIPQAGTAAMTVADVDGVQIAGLLIDAGPVNSPVLLQVGVQGGSRVSHQNNPTSINDVYFRIGGATPEAVSATTSMEIDSDNVILDNIWAWRADHGASPTGWTINVGNNGLIVNGDNVTALGLAVEHYEQNEVLWNGNGGETIFYQNEIPYDVPSQAAWMNGTANGYPSYIVSNSVTTHAAYGLGVYSNFNLGVNIVEDNAITVPTTPGVSVVDAVSVFLSGSGSITATVDGAGTKVQTGGGANMTSYVPLYGSTCSASGTCPAAPANLNAMLFSPTQVNLTWTPSASAPVTYSVFRSTTSGFTPSSANLIAVGVTQTTYADTSAAAATTYYYVVEAANDAGTSAGSSQATAITTAQGGPITTDVVRIDSGLSTGALPTGWVYDEYFTGGAAGASTTHAITFPTGIVNPAPQAVYQTDRKTSGSCTYNSVTYQTCYAIPSLTPGAAYVVDLHFAELSQTAVGAREFNVTINGTRVLTNFDIFATAPGQYTANVQSFYAVADSTGTINVDLSNGAANNPQINGVEIGTGSVTAPVVPTSATASTVSSSQINVNWNGSSPQYEVFRSTTSGFTASAANLIATTTNTSYSDTTCLPSTTYYYLVEANNTELTSLPSNQASATSSGVTITTSAPVAPTALNATTISGGQINVFWTGSATPNLTNYTLFRSTVPGFTPSSSNLLATFATPPATGYVDTGVTTGTTYYYLVEATNSAGTSPASNQAAATTPNTTATVTLSNLAQTYTGSPLSATATTAPSGLAVSLTYNGSTTAPTSAGSYTVVATIDDTTYYGTATGTLVISRAPATVTLSNLSQTYTGSPISATVTTAPLSLSVIVTYNGSTTAPTAVGSYAVVATVNNTNYTGTASGTLVIATNSANNIWLVNSTGTLTQVSEQGTTGASGVGTGGVAATYGGAAIDASGGIWSVSSTNNLINYVTKSGANATEYTDPSLSQPTGIAIDGAGTVWVANSGSSTVSAFTSIGALISTTVDSTISGASGVAVDISGNVWISNATNNSVDEILGAAAPTEPIALATSTASSGTRP